MPVPSETGIDGTEPIEIPTYRDRGFNSRLIKRSAAFERAGTGGGLDSRNPIRSMFYSGNLGSRINIGGNNVRIDGGKGRIIINDGNNERVWIGNLGG